MTAQIGDRYKFENNEYTIVDMSAAIDFHPSEYGIFPVPACTACWSGFWCVYIIKEDGIFLEDLYVHSGNDQYPAINGVLPEQQEGNEAFTYMGHRRYAGLNIQISYTGKILVGDDFLQEYYIHMGYQRPWAFKKLVELVFKDGKLVESKDRSSVAAKVREVISSEEALTGWFFKRRFENSGDNSLIGDATDIWWL